MPVTPAIPTARVAAMAKLATAREGELYERIAAILEETRARVARTVNTAMVNAYWHIGREIVQVDQAGKDRAAYQDRVIDELARKLTKQFGKGFSARSLRRMRQFFLAYPEGSQLPSELGGPEKRPAVLAKSGRRTIRPAVLAKSIGSFPPALGWGHYLLLLTIPNATARAFYEIETTRENWSTRELERQIGSLLFERLAKSRNKKQVLALARDGQRVETEADVMKDPLILEFLGLEEKSHGASRISRARSSSASKTSYWSSEKDFASSQGRSA